MAHDLQNVTESQLTEPQLLAVSLLIADELTDEQIAKECKVSRQTLWVWKKKDEFQAAMRRLIDESEKQILNIGIAQRRRRVDALNDRWRRMKSVIDARAADPLMQDVPGGPSGLLTKQYRGIGHGESFTMVEEYAVDNGLLKELREHEKQAAQEVGQWVDKLAPTTPDGSSEFTSGLTADERAAGVAAVLDIVRKRAAGQTAEGSGEVGTTSGSAELGG